MPLLNESILNYNFIVEDENDEDETLPVEETGIEDDMSIPGEEAPAEEENSTEENSDDATTINITTDAIDLLITKIRHDEISADDAFSMVRNVSQQLESIAREDVEDMLASASITSDEVQDDNVAPLDDDEIFNVAEDEDVTLDDEDLYNV